MFIGAQSLVPSVAYVREIDETREAAEQVALVAAASNPTLKLGPSKPDSKKAGNFRLISGVGFDLVQQVLPVDQTQDTDGGVIFSIGFDTKNKAVMKDHLTKSKGANVFDKGTKDLKKKLEKGKKGSFAATFNATALGKINPRQQSGTGEAAILFGLAGKKQGQYLFITGEVGFTGIIGVNANAALSAANGFDLKGNVDLNGKLSPKIAIGLGVARVGRIDVFGKGDLNVSTTVLPESSAGWNYAKLKAGIGFEIVGFNRRLWSKMLWDGGPWDLFTPRKSINAQSELMATLGLFAASEQGDGNMPIVAVASDGTWYGDSRHFVDAPYAKDEQSVGGATYQSTYMTNEDSTPQEGPRLLKNNVYPDAQVELVSVPGGAVMCWLEKPTGETNDNNASRLMWSRYTASNDVWSQPKQVCLESDATSGYNTADYEPSLFADTDGNVHVVWLNSDREVPQNFQGMQDVTQHLQVRYAKLEKDAPDFSASEVVQAANPTSEYFMTSPKVAAAGDKVMVGWSTTKVANISDGYDSDHDVMVARRKNGVWETAGVSKLDSKFEVTSLEAGVIGTEPSVAWTYDDLIVDKSDAMSGNVTSGTSTPTLEFMTYSTEDATTTVQPAENVDFANQGNQGALVWSQTNEDGTLKLIALTNPASTQGDVLIANADLPANWQIDGDVAGHSLVSYQVWESGELDDRSTTDIYGNVLSGGKLSEENILVAHKDDLTSYSVAYVANRPLVAMAAERGVGSGARSADLLVAQGDSLERLSVDDLYYDMNHVAPGAVVPMQAVVYNDGLVPIQDGVTVEIVDDSTGAVLGRGTYNQPIAVDGSVEVPVSVQVPRDFDPFGFRPLSVKANFMVDTADDSAALNIDTVLVGQGYAESSESGGSADGGAVVYPIVPDTGRRWVDTGYYRSGDSSTATVTSSKVRRESGSDRYETMKRVIFSAFKQSDWAVLASGEGFADALSTQALAGSYAAPVVLTARDYLSPQAADVLRSLGCKHVIVAGGPAAISDATVAEVASIVGDVRRVFGPDRFQTSLESMREARAISVGSNTVLVATGLNFADALSVGPASWKLRMPVVLAGTDGTLSAEVVSAITSDPAISRIVLLGGLAVVSDAVRDQLGPAYEYVRLGGSDRYATSSLVADWACAQSLGWTHPHVVTGRGFADALAGAASAGVRSSVLLLSDDTGAVTLTNLKNHAGEVVDVVILGGSQAVSTEIENYLATTFR